MLTANARYRVFMCACVIHALLVFALWAGMFLFDVRLMSGRVWLVLGWSWLVWPALLVFNRGRSFRRVAIPLAISLAALAPCALTLIMLTGWSIFGFAP